MFFRSLFEKDSLPLLENMTYFTEARHTLLLNDIANIDTPFYKSRDLSIGKFQKLLKEAIEERTHYHRRRFILGENSQVKVDDHGVPHFVPQRDGKAIMRYDYNNVSVEHVMSKLAKNNLMHRTFTQLLRKKYKMMEEAIKGR